MEEDALAQEEEREALRAIYGEEAMRWDPALHVLTVTIGGNEEERALVAEYGGGGRGGGGGNGATAHPPPPLLLRVLTPEDYPSRSPPIVEVVRSGSEDDDDFSGLADLLRRVEDACAQALSGGAAVAAGEEQAAAAWTPGEVAMFALTERAREIRREWLERELQEARRRREQQDEEEEEQAAALRPAAHDAPTPTARPTRPTLEEGCDPADVDRMAKLIVSGDPVVERKSTFQAHVAPVSSVADVKAAVAALLRVPKIRNCTHNIMAYRIRREVVAGGGGGGGNDSKITTTWLADADDDGEDAAGGRLLQLLHNAGCANVVVVVSRWFGGVLLGPSRFALINNTARALLVRERYIAEKK
jgi:hypothetical protein